MRLLALVLAILFAFQTYYPAAADIAFSNGGANGQASCNKIGNLLVADGIAILAGTAITIAATTAGTQTTQLSGHLFHVTTSGKTLQGSCYMNDGPKLSSLDSAGTGERVDLTDGTMQKGSISDCTAESVTIAGKTIAMSQVKAIHSARVFTFHCTMGAHPTISFAPTSIKMSATVSQKTSSSSKVASAGHHTVLKVALFLGVVATAVACGVAIPVACASGHSHHNSSPVYYPSSSSSSSSYNISPSLGCI